MIPLFGVTRAVDAEDAIRPCDLVEGYRGLRPRPADTLHVNGGAPTVH